MKSNLPPATTPTEVLKSAFGWVLVLAIALAIVFLADQAINMVVTLGEKIQAAKP